MNCAPRPRTYIEIVNRIKSSLESDKILIWNGEVEQRGTQKGNKQVAWWMAIQILIVIYKMHGSQKQKVQHFCTNIEEKLKKTL